MVVISKRTHSFRGSGYYYPIRYAIKLILKVAIDFKKIKSHHTYPEEDISNLKLFIVFLIIRYKYDNVIVVLMDYLALWNH